MVPLRGRCELPPNIPGPGIQANRGFCGESLLSRPKWALLSRPGGGAAMFWLLLATGCTGGMTFLFVIRWTGTWLFPPAALDVHFSPKGGCADRVVREIGNAR